MRAALISSLLVALLGCGGAPSAGASCPTAGAAVCDPTDRFTLLECVSGTWRAIPCRISSTSSIAGCFTDANDTRCDYELVLDGDACWSRHQGINFCSKAKSDLKLTCTGGRWVGEACTNCQKPLGGTLSCSP
jgi:hypothetical protein